MFSWGRVRQIVRKEIIQTFREPRMRILLFLPPVIQLVVFGYAVNLDVLQSRLGWFDEDRSVESRQLRSGFEGSPHFSLSDFPRNGSEVESLLDRGEVDAVVHLLPGFRRHLGRGQRARVEVLVEGTNSNTAAIVSAYARQVVARFALGFSPSPSRPRTLQSGSGRLRVWFNENLRSQDYFVPGVLVNIIGLVTVMLTAMAIVREHEIGTLEQLMVTPIRPLELMLGKTLPFALVGLAEVVLVTIAALAIFHIPFRGSPWLLFFSALLFLLNTLGTGLLISTLSGTQQQALMGSFFFFMPAFMLSGFAFPIRNMPVLVQWLTYLNPMRYFLEIVRGIFLKGTGIDVLWPQMLCLALLGTATLLLSARRSALEE